jgi:hypothetical protein
MLVHITVVESNHWSGNHSKKAISPLFPQVSMNYANLRYQISERFANRNSGPQNRKSQFLYSNKKN